MRKKTISYFNILFIFLIILGISGCSSILGHRHRYRHRHHHYHYRNYRHFTYNSYKKVKLPPNYPTKYLSNGNLWNNLRHDLRSSPGSANYKLVKERISKFRKQRRYLNNSIERGAPYIYYLYQQIKKRHLPAELALIPIIEGGYNPAAYNAHSGAVGMWQFMPRTARNFGLKIDRWYDGRRDVVASTNAALKYLTYLYYFFDKNWLLAVAAYNTGEGHVQAAILRNRRHHRPTNFWSLHLASETEDYIPKLLALSAIVKNPSRYGIHLTPVNNAPYFEQVNVGHRIDFKTAARMANISVDYLSMLNLSYSRGITDPNGPYTLLIPRDKVKIFEYNLRHGRYHYRNNIINEEPSDNVNEKLNNNANEEAQEINITNSPQPHIAKSKTILLHHNITKGETLISTARKYHTTTAKLRKINKLKNSKLRVKQTLLIPIKQKPQSYETFDNINNHLHRIIKIKTIPHHHTITKGETLFSIAKKYHTTTTELRKINKLKNSNLRGKQTLLIPVKQKSVSYAFRNKSTSSKSNINHIRNQHRTNNRSNKTINAAYKIKKGDSIYEIAKHFKVSAKELQKVNKIKGHNIRPGKFLIIPTKVGNINSNHKKPHNTKKSSRNATKIRIKKNDDLSSRHVVSTVKHNNQLKQITKSKNSIKHINIQTSKKRTHSHTKMKTGRNNVEKTRITRSKKHHHFK